MEELFILGNPRFLSGGAATSCVIDYGMPPPTVESLLCGKVTSESVLNPTHLGKSLAARVSACGQQVHSGKSGYHHRPRFNVFLHDGENPTAGIELETESRVTTSEHVNRLVDDLKSNWFHMERDGSLDPDHGGEYGFEFITEPLPPRVYRNPMTWAGLQNVLSPWVESYSKCRCGLHVHVGLQQFEKVDGIPLMSPSDRRRVGKYLSAFVYYCLLNPSFVDRVVLRKNGTWSGVVDNPELMAFTGLVSGGKATGGDVVDIVVKNVVAESWANEASRASGRVGTGCSDSTRTYTHDIASFAGHGHELNCEHDYTVEFRRGKGTLNSISIHRTVELMTMIVRYAWKIARNPDMLVSRGDIYRFIAENTTSPALAELARKEI